MEDEGDEDATRYAGRDLAAGKVSFPSWGGKAPKRKKTRLLSDSLASPEEDEDEDDGQGEEGPVTLAMNGKWLLAGFSNGTIHRSLLLPIAESPMTRSNTTN